MTINDMIEHSQSQTLAARRIANRDLPYKHGIGPLWYQITGDGTDDGVVDLGNDRRVAEMGALQKVAVEGICVQWRTIGNELVNRGAICRNGLPEACKPVGAIRFIRCNDYTP